MALKDWFLTLLLACCALLLGACGGASYRAESAARGDSGGSYYPASTSADYARPIGAPMADAMDGDEMMSEPTQARELHAEAAPPGDTASPPRAVPDAPPSPPQAAPEPPPGAPPTVAAPLLIYRAELTMAVFEQRATLSGAEQLARELGGYLVRRSDSDIIIRVPALKFQDALTRLSKLGDLLHQEVEVEDVTERFMDLNVRIKNARTVLTRYEQLLAKATTVEESLKIERELERITTQLELLEGKMKVLRELIAFSTITLRLQGRGAEVTPKVQLPFTWLRELGLPRLLSM